MTADPRQIAALDSPLCNVPRVSCDGRRSSLADRSEHGTRLVADDGTDLCGGDYSDLYLSVTV